MNKKIILTIIGFIFYSLTNLSYAITDKELRRSLYESLNQKNQEREVYKPLARSSLNWPSSQPSSAASAEFSWFDDRFNIYLWRDDSNNAWVKIEPIGSEAFICGPSFDIFQNGTFRLQDTGSSIVKLEHSDGTSVCERVLETSIYKLTIWSFLSDKADITKPFELFYNGGSVSRKFNISFNTSIIANDNLKKSNILFDFAEKNYPDFFSPSGMETFEIQGYLARYYSNTDTYLGTQKENVYVYGDIFNGLKHVGEIDDFIQNTSISSLIVTAPNSLIKSIFINNKGGLVFLHHLSSSSERPSIDKAIIFYTDGETSEINLSLNKQQRSLLSNYRQCIAQESSNLYDNFTAAMDAPLTKLKNSYDSIVSCIQGGIDEVVENDDRNKGFIGGMFEKLKWQLENTKNEKRGLFTYLMDELTPDSLKDEVEYARGVYKKFREITSEVAPEIIHPSSVESTSSKNDLSIDNIFVKDDDQFVTLSNNQNDTPPECSADEADSRNCARDNGVGKQWRHCTNIGQWGEFGSCNLSSCNQGYAMSGVICTKIPDCSIGETSKTSCTVSNGYGEQSRSCSTNGTWGAYGNCEVSSCSSGYEKSGNSCIKESDGKNTITWKVTDKCDDGFYIQYKFRSSDRNLFWGEYKTIGYNRTDEKTLSCVEGEQICFGGKTGNKSWGIGYEGDSGCESCCGRCSGGTYSYNPSCSTQTENDYALSCHDSATSQCVDYTLTNANDKTSFENQCINVASIQVVSSCQVKTGFGCKHESNTRTSITWKYSGSSSEIRSSCINTGGTPM